MVREPNVVCVPAVITDHEAAAEAEAEAVAAAAAVVAAAAARHDGVLADLGALGVVFGTDLASLSRARNSAAKTLGVAKSVAGLATGGGGGE